MGNYRKLVVWKESDELAKLIYKITKDFPGHEMFGITSQLRRAALSVPLNIVEGYGRRSKLEFSRFIDIARGSLSETEYLVEFSKELGYINGDIKEILDLITSVNRLLWNFQKKL